MDTIDATITNVLTSSNGDVYINIDKQVPRRTDEGTVKFTRRLPVDGILKDYISHILQRYGTFGIELEVCGLSIEIEVAPNTLSHRITSKELDERIYKERLAIVLERAAEHR